jgi:hypothetical protein
MRDAMSQFGLLALAVLTGCSDPATVNSDMTGPDFKSAPSGSSYTALVPPLAQGYDAFMPVDINAQHVAIGFMNPAGTTSTYLREGAYWIAGSGTPPVVLPRGPYPTAGIPADIADNGLVAGNIGRAAVLWRQAGPGWEVVTLHEDARVNGVAEDGSAVGAVFNPAYPSQENPQPVWWDASGGLHALPLPVSGQFNGGMAHAITAEGDIGGELQVWTLGHTTVWGALWIRKDDGGYMEPFVLQTGPSQGVSERTSDGQLYATAGWLRDAYRHTFLRDAGGEWRKGDSVYVAGTATDMNASGDFVGTAPKARYALTGTPFLFALTGTRHNLPMLKGATGDATGVSNDAWVTGSRDGVGVIWKR